MAMGGQDTTNGRQINFIIMDQQDIRNVVLMQEVINEIKLGVLTPFLPRDDPMYRVRSLLDIVEMTALVHRLVVEFCKEVPGFDTISPEDQIILREACSSEIVLLWNARKSDMGTDSITTPNNKRFTREDYDRCYRENSMDPISDFHRTLNILKPDDEEYALLAAIVVFSERSSLLEPEKVEKLQEFYTEALKSYIATNRPDDEDYFSKLHSLLLDIRILGEMKIELESSFKVPVGYLPSSIREWICEWTVKD